MLGGRVADDDGDPRMSRDRATLGERLRNAILKPVEEGAAPIDKASDEPRSVEELKAAVKSADDKERLIGLLAAPFAAAIAILVISALIANDPAPLLQNGQVNKLHVSVSVYHELLGVLAALSILMIVTAMLRKRLYLGIVTALYGLAVFNLHYWGFGVPFVLVGSWLLVRAYRLQRELRVATGGTSSRRATNATPPEASKRYTPPTRRSSPPRSEDERRVG